MQLDQLASQQRLVQRFPGIAQLSGSFRERLGDLDAPILNVGVTFGDHGGEFGLGTLTRVDGGGQTALDLKPAVRCNQGVELTADLQ